MKASAGARLRHIPSLSLPARPLTSPSSPSPFRMASEHTALLPKPPTVAAAMASTSTAAAAATPSSHRARANDAASNSTGTRVKRPAMTATDTLHLTLPDRRTLAYAQYGSPGGFPLIYLHGFPTSRLEGTVLHRAALKRGIRVLAPDRPGFGESTYDPGYTVGSVVGDVRELVRQLGLKKFVVMGLSGGGPYAIGCAREMGRRDGLVGVAVACGSPYWFEGGFGGMPWWSWVAWWLARWAPPVGRMCVTGFVGLGRWVAEMGWAKRSLMKAIERERAKERERRGTGEGEIEQEERTPEDSRKEIMRMALEGVRQGSAPTVRECWLLTTDWGFKLSDVTYDKVILWHGKKDINAPISGARYIAGALPHAELREYDGNHGEIITQIDDMLDTLVPEEERGGAEEDVHG